MNRCPYCGHVCHGYVCHWHRDLFHGINAAGNRQASPPLDPHRYAQLPSAAMQDAAPTLRESLREAVQSAREREV